MRALVVLLVAVFVSVSIAPSAMARPPRPREEVPGDADDVGGLKDPESVRPNQESGSNTEPYVQQSPRRNQVTRAVDVRLWHWYWFNVLVKRL
jgi:hypothetical protein